MKTLIITLEYPPQIGGVASYAYNLASHLPVGETVVWAPKTPGDGDFDAKNAWKTYRGVPYYALFWPHWLKLYWQIKRIVRIEGVQQIYVHHVLPVGYIAQMIKKSFKIPFTVFFHGTDLEVGLKNKKKKIINVCRAAAKVVVNSEFLAKKLVSQVTGLDQNKIVVVSPGPANFFFTPLPAEEIKKLKASLALEGKKVLLTVARLEEGKGYPHLLHLLPEIIKKVPNAVLVIIGDGPKKKLILDQIQKNNLQNCVRFMGNIPYNELPKYYQLADVFVLLTHKDESHEEGWGMVFLEAAASGVPVVAGRAGGVEEAVQNLQTGVVVDVYQTQGVISAIISLLQQSEYAKKMGATGFARAQTEFNWDKQLAKLK